MEKEINKRDLVLAPNTYAFMQDTSKGVIKTFVGPTVINQTAQEVPLVYKHKEGFVRVDRLDLAVQVNAIAVEGWYLELLNPATTGRAPEAGAQTQAPDLAIGRRVNLCGPVCIPLWPGQHAQAIRGHHLRPNQYLLGRVYNSEEARKHWDDAIVNTTAVEAKPTRKNPLPLPENLTEGLTFVIKGTEVAFYMPPTGVVVESEPNGEGACVYVRDALTLERLEYCILVSDNGGKRYEQGPKVVFPLPDERFITVKDDKGKVSRKFQAIELNDIQGIHIKVSAPYTDEKGVKHTAGEELFVTGVDLPIFFPREEHSIVKYDGQTKHFATAIPVGEARYVMNRKTGEIRLVRGPAMLLPNPIHEVIVRRALTDRECVLMYPGNLEVLAYNQSLRELAEKTPTTRSGAISENEALRNSAKLGQEVNRVNTSNSGGQSLSRNAAQQNLTVSYAATSQLESALTGAVMETSHVGRDQFAVGDEFSRSATYTQPRTITLVNKFNGVPQIGPWTGYAVLVVDPHGNRRVVEGPARVLLAYDETLEALELSSGKPKTTDKPFRTAYLRTTGNRVTDVFSIETTDHVFIELKLEYSVQFEGEDRVKWFQEANYVKLLCDHVRSLMKGIAQGVTLEDFYRRATEIIRDSILGKKGETPRPGLYFASNAMRVVDVNVLDATIKDPRVKKLMDDTQFGAVASVLQVSSRESNLVMARKTAEIDIQIERLKATLAGEQAALTIAGYHQRLKVLEAELVVTLTSLGNRLHEQAEQLKLEVESQKLTTFAHEANLERTKRTDDQRLQLAQQAMGQRITEMQAEAEALIRKMGTIGGPLAEAMVTLSRNDVLEKMAQAWSFQTTIGGKTVVDALAQVFENTPLASYIAKLVTLPSNGKGGSAGPIDVVHG